MSGIQYNCTNLSAGLVLEDGFYKYLLLERGLSGGRVVKTISQRLDTTGEDVYKKLFNHLDERGAPKDVPMAFALRFDESMIKIIDMYPFSVEDVKLALRYQFEDYFPFTSKESNYDVQEITFPAQRKEEKRFLAAACRSQVINDIKNGAEKRGFNLSCVEPSQISFERAVTSEGYKENLIEIYAGRTDLLLVLSNGKNGVFYRNAVIRQEGQEYIERSVSEIKASLDLASGRIPSFTERQVIIAGPNASEMLRMSVAKVLGHLKVKLVDPFVSYSADIGTRTGADMILSFGAALRRM